MLKNEIRTLFKNIKKINSKWIKILNVRQDTTILLEEKIGKTLTEINCSKLFFDLLPRVMKNKQMGPN